MRKPFDSEYRLTQGFNDPCCRASYAKFGLQGHNGHDYATPSGTRILAPHDGKVIEATLDLNGYGIYVKIENSIEGSVLAHLREYRVGVGDGVKEGDLIGYSDNSGNSTGPHLHWGYYRFPRDRQNGFAGFIDQTPYIGQQNTQPELQAELDKVRLERDRNWLWFTQVCEALGVGANVEAAVNEAHKLVGNDDVLVQKDKALQEAQTEISDLKAEVTRLQEVNTTQATEVTNLKTEMALQVSTLTEKATELEKKYQQSTRNYEDALAKIHILQGTMVKPSKGWKKIIDGIFELIGRK